MTLPQLVRAGGPRPPRCSSGATASVTVADDVVEDIELPLRGDDASYTAASRPAPCSGEHELALTGDDEAQQVTLPFRMPFYSSGKACRSTRTRLRQARPTETTAASSRPLPSAGARRNAIYPYWDDFVVDTKGGVYSSERARRIVRDRVARRRLLRRAHAAGVVLEEGAARARATPSRTATRTSTPSATRRSPRSRSTWPAPTG